MKMALKKGRVIAASLAVALMLSGAGYAAWTDQLTINNTVSTGELRVEFDEKFFSAPIFPATFDRDTAGEVKYTTTTANQDSKKLTVKVENMYPGAMSLYVSKIVNKGTIPVVFGQDPQQKSIKVNFTQDNQGLKDNLVVAGGYMLFSGNHSYKQGNFFIGTLGELEDKLFNILKGVRMEPGDYLLFDIPEEYKDEVQAVVKPYNPDENNCIVFYLPEGVEEEDANGNKLEDQTAVFDIGLNLKQHNQ
jgi:predicted ribosomally synthesized peptide with SipW-like signal peptide